MHSILSLVFGRTLEPSTATLLLVVADVVALAAVPSVLLRRAGRPLAAISWILALLALPFAGVSLWMLLGRRSVRRKQAIRRGAREVLCAQCTPAIQSAQPLDPRVRAITPFATASRRWSDGVFPPAPASAFQLLCDGDEAFPAMEAAMEAAEREILALFYIWQSDETGARMARLLAMKARDGVRVRVLVDAGGSAAFLRRHGPDLERAGAKVTPFFPRSWRLWAPTFNFRNHRKLLVIDGRRAFFGGMNIGDEYAHRWHDLAFEVRGVTVEALRDVFVEDWHSAAGDLLDELSQAQACADDTAVGQCVVIASGPDRDENRAHDAFFLAIGAARQRVWLTTPYFIPSSAVSAALRGAALRGVDVRLIVPRHGDLRIVEWASKSYYEDLLRAGVGIFEYERATLHAKALVIDDDVCLLGSANADIRSFRLNFELVCVVFSHGVAATLSQVFRDDLEHCRPIDIQAVLDRPKRAVLLEAAAHLLSPLL